MGCVCCGKDATVSYNGIKRTGIDDEVFKKIDFYYLATHGSIALVARLKRAKFLGEEIFNINGLRGVFVEMKITPPDKQVGEQLQRSSFKTYKVITEWVPPERFQFISTNKHFTRVSLSLFIYNAFTEPDFLGSGSISLDHIDITDTGTLERTVLILDPVTGEQRGEIDFELTASTIQQAKKFQEHEMYEYQRWQPFVGWGNSFPGHLLPTDPGRFSNLNCDVYADDLKNIEPEVPKGWTVTKSWYTVSTEEDLDGWEYSYDYHRFTWFTSVDHSSLIFVRRRRWFREIALNAEAQVKSNISDTGAPDSTSSNSKNPILLKTRRVRKVEQTNDYF